MLAYAFHDVTMPQLAALCHAFGDDVGKASRWLERTRHTHKGRRRYFTKGHYNELYSGDFVLDMKKKSRGFHGNKKKVVIKANSRVNFLHGNLFNREVKTLYDYFDAVFVDQQLVGIRNFVNQPLVLKPGSLTTVKLIAKPKNKQVSGSRVMEIKGPGVLDDLFDFMINIEDWLVPTIKE